MMRRTVRRPLVAILGGGVSGAGVAYHLACVTGFEAVDIVVIEPREALGHGLAYGTAEPAHRINVPASRMTLIGDDCGHFATWLSSSGLPLSPGTETATGDLYPERSVFGAYMAAQLAPFVAAGRVSHLRSTAVAVEPRAWGSRVTLANGSVLEADLTVLAMTHPLPAVPRPLAALGASRRLIADPYDPALVAGIGADERVLIVGSGLTAADVAATLDRRGHSGPIVAISRRGLRSRGHGDVPEKSHVDFGQEPARTALGLLRRIRQAVRADARRGISWHRTLDRVREQGAEIWAALEQQERARLVRHLRVYWDVHRFRIAPQVAEVLARREAEGSLSFEAAHLVAAVEVSDGILVTRRRSGTTEHLTERFDRIVVTTGPAHSDVLRRNPALDLLAAAGAIAPDPLGLGLHVADLCRAVDREGHVSDRLLVAGPLARGHVGELMGLPEVTRHAETVAKVLASLLRELPLVPADRTPGA